MTEVCDNLYVGDENDYESRVRFENNDEWKIIHACKEPYHRRALGYSGRGVPKSHPEYLVAYRDHRLILNLIDADDPEYIPKEIIDEALEFIDKNVKNNQKVLLHCNQGMSRSAGIAILYLAQKGVINSESFQKAKNDFRGIYPRCNLSNGISEFLVRQWNSYMD